MIPHVAISPPNFPPVPPKRFELEAEEQVLEAREDGSSFFVTYHYAGRSWENAFSSGRSSDMDRLRILIWELDAPTASKAGLSERYANLLRDDSFIANVNQSDSVGNVFELRRLTGFTWARLADLLNVDRRTLNNWIKGAGIRDLNRSHIAKSLEVLRSGDCGSSRMNAKALDEVRMPGEPSAYEAVKAGKYTVAMESLAPALATSERREVILNSSSWIGEFQPFAMHEAAEGSGLVEALPDIPEPTYSKRPIKRG